MAAAGQLVHLCSWTYSGTRTGLVYWLRLSAKFHHFRDYPGEHVSTQHGLHFPIDLRQPANYHLQQRNGGLRPVVWLRRADLGQLHDRRCSGTIHGCRPYRHRGGAVPTALGAVRGIVLGIIAPLFSDCPPRFSSFANARKQESPSLPPSLLSIIENSKS